MFCPRCQADIASKARFCPNCGTDLAFSDKDLTQTIAGDIRELKPGDTFSNRYEIANFHALLNHRVEAFKYLEKAVDCGWADWPAFDSDAGFEDFRKQPDYREKIQDFRNISDVLEGIAP